MKSYRVRRKKQTRFFYVPEPFDPVAVLPEPLKKYADEALYFCHCLTSARAFRDANPNGYHQLKVKYLETVISPKVERPIRMALIRAGVVECDGRYVIGSKAMGYRYNPAYSGATRRVEMTGRSITRRIALHKTSIDVSHPVHDHLKNHLRNLTIDRNQADEIIRSMPNGEGKTAALDLVMMIADGSLKNDYTVCRQGRVHTPVTRMPRILRPAIRLYGHPLVSVDVSCCQPTLLLILMLQKQETQKRLFFVDFLGNGAKRTYLDSFGLCGREGSGVGTGVVGEAPSTLRSTNEQIILSNPLESKELWRAQKYDVQQYGLLVESGQFYDHLSTYPCLKNVSRDDLKVRFYAEVFYGHNRLVTDLTRAFGADFPTVLKFIRAFKKKDPRQLPRVLQYLESSVMIGRVCARFAASNPLMPLITLHDAILTTTTNVGTVTDEIRSAFEELGIGVTVRTE